MNTQPKTMNRPAGRITIDLAALVANWRDLAGRVPGAETGACVKADAYGHGIEPVVRALSAAGCRTFFVALVEEGVRVRAAAPEANIYVLNGYADGDTPALEKAQLRPVLGSRPEIGAWLVENANATVPVALHVDTGMNRLGLTLDEFRAVAADPALVERLRPALVMSHFACADTPDHPLNGVQAARFAEMCGLLPDVPASLANSAAILSRPDAAYDITRPGIALYGGRALSAQPNPMRPVATVEARIIQVREVPAGAAVGYGATFRAGRDGRVAIVSAGYADGYLRRAGASDAGPGAHAAIDGCPVPVAGRVSMDLIALDVTDAPPGLARRGAFVELFGPTIPVDTVADHAGTIGYELLTSLGRRFERRYVG